MPRTQPPLIIAEQVEEHPHIEAHQAKSQGLGTPQGLSPDINVLDDIPRCDIDITRLPDEQQRRIYEAFH